MVCLDKIKSALLSCTSKVYHFKAANATAPYVVWAEDGQAKSVWAGNRMVRQGISGTVDLYTKTLNGEPLFGAIQAALNGVCSWRLNSVQYEDDTGLLHYEWVFEVENG